MLRTNCSTGGASCKSDSSDEKRLQQAWVKIPQYSSIPVPAATVIVAAPSYLTHPTRFLLSNVLYLSLLQEARYAAGVARFDFDRGLAPYDLNRYSQWVSLSCHISQQLLDEVMPVSQGLQYELPMMILIYSLARLQRVPSAESDQPCSTVYAPASLLESTCQTY